MGAEGVTNYEKGLSSGTVLPCLCRVYLNKKVKATGTVEEREGKMVITVTSYEVIQE